MKPFSCSDSVNASDPAAQAERLALIAAWNENDLPTVRAEMVASLLRCAEEMPAEEVSGSIELISALQAPKLVRLALRTLSRIHGEQCIPAEQTQNVAGKPTGLEDAFQRLEQPDFCPTEEFVAYLCKELFHEQELDIIVLLLDALTNKSIASDEERSLGASSIAVNNLRESPMVQRLAAAQERACLFSKKEDSDDTEPDGPSGDSGESKAS